MSKEAGKVYEPGSLTAAMARLLGSHLGVLALAVTYAAGLLNDVSQATALFRAVAAGLALFVAGRMLGRALGRSIEGMVTGQRVTNTPDGESAR